MTDLLAQAVTLLPSGWTLHLAYRDGLYEAWALDEDEEQADGAWAQPTAEDALRNLVELLRDRA